MTSYIFALVVLTIVLIGNSVGPDAVHISTRYFDSILHILGGIGLGLFFVGLTRTGTFRDWHTISKITLIVLGCGIVWEIFELYFGISGYVPWTMMYYLDTAKDLLLDVVGAAFASYIAISRH